MLIQQKHMWYTPDQNEIYSFDLPHFQYGRHIKSTEAQLILINTIDHEHHHQTIKQFRFKKNHPKFTR